MSVKLMGIVFELNDTISSLERLLLLALTDHADHEGDNVYPSVGLLCRKTGICERSVRDFLRSFRDSGILKVVKESTPTSPTRYKIDIEKLQSFRGACGAGGACYAPLGVHVVHHRGASGAPNPSLEPSEDKTSPSESASHRESLKLEAGSETSPHCAAPSPSGSTEPPDTRTGGRSGRGGGKAFVKQAPKWDGPAPYLEIWKKRFGGYFPVERSSRQFRQAEKDHGRERVIEAFKQYVEKVEQEYASPISFCQKVAVWLPKEKEKSKSKGYIPDNWSPPE